MLGEGRESPSWTVGYGAPWRTPLVSQGLCLAAVHAALATECSAQVSQALGENPREVKAQGSKYCMAVFDVWRGYLEQRPDRVKEIE